MTVILIGGGGLLVQTLFLRKLLSLFSGNELHLGLGLAVWLLSSGTGAMLGRKLKKDLLPELLIITGIISFLAFALTGFVRTATSQIPGESIAIGKTLLWTVLMVSPPAMLSGVLFSSSVMRWKRGGLIFCLESLGAFMGGLCFVLIFSGRINSLLLCGLASLVLFLTGLRLSNKKVFSIFLLLFPLFYLAGIHAEELQWKPYRVLDIHESKYQEIAILTDSSHSIVYTAGRFFYSYPDTLRDERDAHIPMSLHNAPERVLLIGVGLPCLREFLKYPLKRIDLIEIDPLLIDISRRLLSTEDRAILEDRRLRIISGDPRLLVKGLHERYDLVVLNTPEPETALLSRYYTLEFFMEIKRVLAPDGIVFLNLPVSYGYISRPLMRLNGTIYNTLKEVFNHSLPSSEDYGILIASDSFIDLTPSMLTERFNGRKIPVRFFEPSLFYDIFSPLKIEAVKERFSHVKGINTDSAPVAYFYALLFWAYSEKGILSSILNGGLPAVMVLLIFIFVSVFLRLKKAVSYTIFTTGFMTMAFQLIIILHYQTLFGYVYERVGLLSSFFMLGLAAGSWVFSERGDIGRFRLSELLFILLTVLCFFLPEKEVIFYLASMSAGFLGGLQFSMAGHILRDRPYPSSWLYAIDLGGSFAGALITTLYLVPLAGVRNSLFILAIIKLSSLTLLFKK